MRVGVLDAEFPNHSATDIVRMLSFAGAQLVCQDSIPANLDCVIVPGGDKGVRRYFGCADVPSVPVLGVSEAESGGFLAQSDIRELAADVARLGRVEYTIKELPRLSVRVDGGEPYPVLNDAAVFSSKSAVLMEYTLNVNGQEVWHDNSDGVIISTPIGSTAYFMSAGGPMIYEGAMVFGIVSVNSLDVTRRPLIVPGDSIIKVNDISARVHCEVVLDGTERLGVKKSVEYATYDTPARIIRMRSDATSIAALQKKVNLAGDLLQMPPSAKLLLKTLQYEGSMSQHDLAARTLLPDRTVRMSLGNLVRRGYVKRKVSVRDARRKIYEISSGIVPGQGSIDKGQI